MGKSLLQFRRAAPRISEVTGEASVLLVPWADSPGAEMPGQALLQVTMIWLASQVGPGALHAIRPLGQHQVGREELAKEAKHGGVFGKQPKSLEMGFGEPSTVPLRNLCCWDSSLPADWLGSEWVGGGGNSHSEICCITFLL